MPGNPYYKSPHWNRVRKAVLQRDGYRCQNCGQLCLGRKRNGYSPHVDHIKPRPRYAQLATLADVPENCETLCHTCHSKKTNWVDAPTKDPVGYDGFPIGWADDE